MNVEFFNIKIDTSIYVSISLSLSLYIYIYIYMCVCVCVCVCESKLWKETRQTGEKLKNKIIKSEEFIVMKSRR